MNTYDDTPPPTIVPVLHPNRTRQLFIAIILLLLASTTAYLFNTLKRDNTPDTGPADPWLLFAAKGGWVFTFEYDIGELVNTAAERQTDKTPDDKALANIANAVENAQTNIVQTLTRRLNLLGFDKHIVITDPDGAPRLTVRIPGAPTERGDEIAAALTEPAFISFHIVHPGSDEMSRKLLYGDIAPPGLKTEVIQGQIYYIPDTYGAALPPPPELRDFGDPPPDCVCMPHHHYLKDNDIRDVYTPLFAHRRPFLTRDNIVRAHNDHDKNGNPVFRLQFNAEGKTTLAQITAKPDLNMPRKIAIVIDGLVYSTPQIIVPINNGAITISGRVLIDKPRDFVKLFNSGTLPTPLKIVEREFVAR